MLCGRDDQRLPMDQPIPPGLTTRLVHADRQNPLEHGALHTPISTSTQFGSARTQDVIDVFQGRRKNAYSYSRQGTPSTASLEALITQLEGGVGSIVFASGMAALTALFMTLLRAGDHLVCARDLFGNTSSLLGTLAGLGVAISRPDASNADAVAAALQPNTRIVFVETIANPGTQVADLPGIGALCQQRGLLFVVDNTVTSPALCQPGRWGAGLVINSLTKSIAGHGAALGGAVTDTGRFDWQGYPNLFDGYRQGDPRGWGLQQIRKKGLRDMGGTLAPEQAHRISVGAETLALRLQRSSQNALALAGFLARHPAVARVRYPMLPDHPQHALARRLFSASSWLLSFELHDVDRMLPVLDRLQLAIKTTGLGDTRTLVLPMAPTIFWEMGAAARAAFGIAEGLVRVSVGIEDEADLLADFDQALA